MSMNSFKESICSWTCIHCILKLLSEETISPVYVSTHKIKHVNLFFALLMELNCHYFYCSRFDYVATFCKYMYYIIYYIYNILYRERGEREGEVNFSHKCHYGKLQ